MDSTKELFCLKPFYLITLDPVHIGTGGNRLGRVDNSIVREPGTRLPKIPGTSLSGAIRQYSAYRYGSMRCAGSGQGKNESHCHDDKCPICYTFGYLRGQDGGQSGKVNIGDARLLLFPVYSLAGPIWVTCPGALKMSTKQEVSDPGDQVYLSEKLKSHSHLNLGWLMLEKATHKFELKGLNQLPSEIREQTVLVSDRLFTHVVNSNLEIRTSVSIDPETGAAADKSLFTYEAIPRAAVLWFEVMQDDFRDNFPKTNKKCKVETEEENGKKKYIHNSDKSLGEEWKKPIDVVEAGLKIAEYLGIGGMGTRGFGRVRLLKEENES